MLITTAPWLLVLGKVVMTPERRLVGVVVNYIYVHWQCRCQTLLECFRCVAYVVLAGLIWRKSRSTKEYAWCVAIGTN